MVQQLTFVTDGRDPLGRLALEILGGITFRGGRPQVRILEEHERFPGLRSIAFYTASCGAFRNKMFRIVSERDLAEEHLERRFTIPPWAAEIPIGQVIACRHDLDTCQERRIRDGVTGLFIHFVRPEKSKGAPTADPSRWSGGGHRVAVRRHKKEKEQSL